MLIVFLYCFSVLVLLGTSPAASVSAWLVDSSKKVVVLRTTSRASHGTASISGLQLGQRFERLSFAFSANKCRIWNSCINASNIRVKSRSDNYDCLGYPILIHNLRVPTKNT